MGFEHMHVHDIPLATLSLMTTHALSHFNNYSRNQKHMSSLAETVCSKRGGLQRLGGWMTVAIYNAADSGRVKEGDLP